MAIRQLDSLTINGTSYSLMQLVDIGSQISQYQGFPYQIFPGGTSSIPSMLDSRGADFCSVMGSTWVTDDDEILKNIDGKSAYLRQYYSSNLGTDVISLICGNSEVYQDIYRSGSTIIIQMYLALAVDDDTQKGYAFILARTNNGMWYGTAWTTGDSNLSNIYNALQDISTRISNGGGATHIAKVTGQLKDLSSNLSDILMVSGGGGGGLLVGDTDYSGKEAGGISGSGDNSADQSTGNAFGQGESGTNISGGGSGLYGGYKGTSSKSGGAGSGYIGNSLLSNKKMVGYNVPTSSAEGTKTESVNEYSASGEANKPKSGNGKAKIRFLREMIQEHVFEVTASSAMTDSDNVTPRIMNGGGTYSSENGYYCTEYTRLHYDKIISNDILKGSGYIDFDVVGMNHSGRGQNCEFEIDIRRNENNNVVLVFVVANGYDDSGSNREIAYARDDSNNLHYWRDSDGSILDVNKDAFYNVKLRLWILNSILVKAEVFIENELWKTYTSFDNCSFANWQDTLNVRIGFIDNSGIKSVKITRFK